MTPIGKDGKPYFSDDTLDGDDDGLPGLTYQGKVGKLHVVKSRPITQEEDNLLNAILDQAPYVILSRGPKTLKMIAMKLPGFLGFIFNTIAWSLERAAKHIHVEVL